MTNCTDCRYQENMCKWPCDDCVKGDKWEERPLTNADKIRAMTDEELAKWFCDKVSCGCECLALCRNCGRNDKSCSQAWLNWLKQEVKEC